MNPNQPTPNNIPQPVYSANPAVLPQYAQPGLPPAVAQPGANPTAPVNKSNPNSTQNSLEIAEIRDGIVIMDDGSYRSVILIKSINFDLMSPDEREAVEAGYQGFLNSLYFPIQIYMRSERVDIRPYIERLEKIRSEHSNMLLALLMEDYVGFIDNLAQQTNIMDKHFYLVVPYFSTTFDPKAALQASKNLFGGIGKLLKNKETHVVINEADLISAKSELTNRVQAVLAGLQQCGVRGLPLDTQELIELYYDVYNPDTATRQPIKNFDDLTAPVVTKGEGSAPQPNLERQLL